MCIYILILFKKNRAFVLKM